jgi:hypothetical protein
MSEINDFRAERDPRLGERLRAHLAATDHPAFVRGVLARLDEMPGRRDGSSWDVLAGWARPGIAAAILLATLAGAAFVVDHARNSADSSTVLAEAIERDQLVGVVLGAGH